VQKVAWKLGLLQKYILVFLGSVALGIGIAGIFIPVLPTTPLLLLASYCYLRSSKRMYHWLITHKIFGSYLYCYLTYKAIPRKTKAGTIMFLWGTLLISLYLSPSLHIRIFLVAVGISVSVHLLMLKTLSPAGIKDPPPS
jgi:uncharacterized protein